MGEGVALALAESAGLWGRDEVMQALNFLLGVGFVARDGAVRGLMLQSGMSERDKWRERRVWPCCLLPTFQDLLVLGQRRGHTSPELPPELCGSRWGHSRARAAVRYVNPKQKHQENSLL